MSNTTDIIDLDTGPLAKKIDEWAADVLGPYLQQYPSNPHIESKSVHDPIGKAIDLQAWEVFLVDSPIFQRLRFIRQLGVGHFLFPTSGYSRFEHSLGCVKTATTLFDAVSDSGSRPMVAYANEELTARRDIIRLAALLHDIGHCILSHVSEKFYAQDPEVISARDTLRRYYRTNGVAPAETITILIIRSDAFRKLLATASMRRSKYNDREIINKICACIAGSKFKMLPDAYLAEIINGPVDCDKLDYLARDAHMAGVPISLDIDRLFSKLRIVKTLGTNSVPIHSLAIVPSGVRALEEMLVSRIFLYDKFYYHPKIMAAEELVRRALFYLAEACPEFRSPRTLLEFGDDEFLSLTAAYIGSRYQKDVTDKNLVRGCSLLQRARTRDLPKRAFAFAKRFIPEMPEAYSRFVNEGKAETVSQAVQDYIDLDKLLLGAGGTDLVARTLEGLVTDLSVESEIFVGYQSAQRAAGKMDMPVVLPGDVVETTPDFLFNVSKWSDAYALNKQTSYVFAYKDLPKVHLATERYFAERGGMVFAPKSWVWTKLSAEAIDATRNSLPVNEEWLPHRLSPDYLVSKRGQERLQALREKFSPYLNAFDAILGPQLVESWVWQFGDADLQESALSFLEHITFIGKGDVIGGFGGILKKKPELAKALWVPMRPREGQGASAELVKYDLKEHGLTMCDLAMLTADKIENAQRVVFFDDLLNSGVQAECRLVSWLDPNGECENPDDRDTAGLLPMEVREALKKVTIDFAYYSTHPTGVQRLSEACKKLGLNIGDITGWIDVSVSRYTIEGFRGNSTASRSRFLRVLQERGEKLLSAKYESNPKWNASRIRDFALGFGGLGLTFVYRHSVSTAIPVALWQMSSETLDPWLPLFPRKEKKLRKILDPYRQEVAEDIGHDSLPDYGDREGDDAVSQLT